MITYLTVQAWMRILICFFSIYRKSFGRLIFQAKFMNRKQSSASMVWNYLVRRGLENNFKKVSELREYTRKSKSTFYPPLKSPLLGCVSKMEEVNELRKSFWFTMKGCEFKENQHSQPNGRHNPKVMMFIHGGGYVSGGALGMEAQAMLFAVRDYNMMAQKSSNPICSHVLSVEHRLLADPDEYSTMDRNLLTNSMADQIEDCLQCLKWLVYDKHIPPRDIVLVGNSSGAALIVNMILLRLIGSNDTSGRRDHHVEDQQTSLSKHEELWPVHSVALFSTSCDISRTIIHKDLVKENLIVAIPTNLQQMFEKCLPPEDKRRYSVLKNLLEMEKTDQQLYQKLFQSKWVINYSKHEELSPGNDYFVNLLKQHVDSQSEDKLKVITKDYQMHCYSIGYSIVPEARIGVQQSLEACIP
ncbi:hypothetical protein C9374_009796 [Naegleria lovaniensis]|uniref:Alpha/beta hydrolase fold-3 domain-containing protein n=1 Tax=Naegleria lovaniensis TaxID=51637 RepID=A0AA88KS20_NAELO|nr:uncharacterized protein C9374_009796 [Naegleria lovaniensis]KAG2393219.1 hypothetical protein C9374_009796 [Naegleria lovaniensis]